MTFSVEHIGLAAVDPVRLKDWCVRMLDAELVYSDGKTPPAFFVRLPGGALLLEIYAGNPDTAAGGDNRTPGWRHLALRVPSVEAARDLLLKRGVAFEPLIKPAGGGGRVLFFSDPEGNLWHLVERLEDSPFAKAGDTSLQAPNHATTGTRPSLSHDPFV